MPKRKYGKGTFEIKKGLVSDAKVGKSIVLITPTRMGFSVARFKRNYQKLQKAGIPVPKIKGQISEITRETRKKGLIRRTAVEQEVVQKPGTVMVETLREVTYNDLIANAREISDMLDKAEKKKLTLDLITENLGVDRNGRLKIMDVSHIYTRRLWRKKRVYERNLGTLIDSVEYDYDPVKARRLKALIQEERMKK